MSELEALAEKIKALSPPDALRIDHAVRDLVAEMLLARRGDQITPALALERAANIALSICNNFKVSMLHEEQRRPDPSGDDGRIT